MLENYDPRIVALGIFGVSILFALLMKRFLKIVGSFTEKTKTTLDETILENIRLPIQLIVITLGLFLAIKYSFPEISLGAVGVLQIFSALWIFSVAFLTARLTRSFFDWYTDELHHKLRRKIDNTIFVFLRKVINFSIYLIALGIALQQFGIEITPILAGLGIAGIGIALALKDTLANLFSAFYITIDRPMKIGDYIEIDANTAGYVADIGWRSTRLRTWDHNYIILPNAKIAEAIFKNYNAPRNEMTARVSCGVSYDSKLDKVEKIALDVAKKIQKKVEGAVEKYEPTFRFREFADNAITFTVNLRVKNRAARSRVVHEYIKALKTRFDKEKIEIPFPQMDVWMRND